MLAVRAGLAENVETMASNNEDLPAWARWRPNEFLIAVHVQPGAKRSAVLGEHGGRLKVAVHAPPAEGKANAELLRLLGEVLRVRRDALRIVAGESSRQKSVAVMAERAEVAGLIHALAPSQWPQ
jgi:uncharacterized protein (TIGR00251 family)